MRPQASLDLAREVVSYQYVRDDGICLAIKSERLVALSGGMLVPRIRRHGAAARRARACRHFIDSSEWTVVEFIGGRPRDANERTTLLELVLASW